MWKSSIRNVTAVFFKQLKSLLYKPVYLGTSVAFLVLGFVVTLVTGDHVSTSFASFLPMIVGMQLLMASSALISEDKSTMNLRFMAMAGVRPGEYSAGVWGALMLAATAVALAFTLTGGFWGVSTFVLMGVLVSASAISILLGIMFALSKMPYVTTPLAIILGLGPMMASGNDTLAEVFRFVYTNQLRLVLDYMARHAPEEIVEHICQSCGEIVFCTDAAEYAEYAANGVLAEAFFFFGITAAVALGLMVYMNKKYGLSG